MPSDVGELEKDWRRLPRENRRRTPLVRRGGGEAGIAGLDAEAGVTRVSWKLSLRSTGLLEGLVWASGEGKVVGMLSAMGCEVRGPRPGVGGCEVTVVAESGE